MATPADIAALRLLIAEPDDGTYTDAVLAARLDAGVNEYAVASDIWTEKAAAAAGLVDMSEGGSTRKMGDVYAQMLKMASEMSSRANAADPPVGSTGVRVSKLTRA